MMEQRYMTAKEVEGIFGKLEKFYGNEWRMKWKGCNMHDVHSEWAEQLGSLHDWQIDFALANLPERAPNLIAFKKLAQSAPEGKRPACGNTDPLHGRTIYLCIIGKEAVTVAAYTREDALAWARRHDEGAKVLRALRDNESPALARLEERERMQSAPHRLQTSAPMPAARNAQQFDDAEALPW